MAEVTSAQIHRYTVQKLLPASIVYRKTKGTSRNPQVYGFATGERDASSLSVKAKNNVTEQTRK